MTSENIFFPKIVKIKRIIPKYHFFKKKFENLLQSQKKRPYRKENRKKMYYQRKISNP